MWIIKVICVLIRLSKMRKYFLLDSVLQLNFIFTIIFGASCQKARISPDTSPFVLILFCCPVPTCHIPLAVSALLDADDIFV